MTNILDNLNFMQVEFLPPWRKGEARSPSGRLILNWMKRERKAVRLESYEPIRRAELRMGRNTNSCLNRRHALQAYEDYRLVPKWIQRNQAVFTVGLASCRTEPGCAPKVSRRTVRPCTQRQMKFRNGVRIQSLSPTGSRCQPYATGSWDCLRSQCSRESREIS